MAKISKLLTKRSLGLVTVLLVWSLSVGWGLTQATAQTNPLSNQLITQTSTQENLKLGQEMYLENCASCHLPIPAEVLPTETWKNILLKPLQHYGQRLSNLPAITIKIIWGYLGEYSRPLSVNESKPDYVRQSRYFRLLHPQVELPEVISSQSCVACHPNAPRLDYITLSPEWENKP